MKRCVAPRTVAKRASVFGAVARRGVRTNRFLDFFRAFFFGIVARCYHAHSRFGRRPKPTLRRS